MTQVLIVEDNYSLADLLQDVLQTDGYHVTGIVRTREEAVAAIRRQEPDFAVIDVNLAHGSVGNTIKADLGSGFEKLGILFSTGSDGGLLTSAEGDAVMTKPYRLSDVGRALKIIAELIASGKTELPFPRSFRLLGASAQV